MRKSTFTFSGWQEISVVLGCPFSPAFWGRMRWKRRYFMHDAAAPIPMQYIWGWICFKWILLFSLCLVYFFFFSLPLSPELHILLIHSYVHVTQQPQLLPPLTPLLALCGKHIIKGCCRRCCCCSVCLVCHDLRGVRSMYVYQNNYSEVSRKWNKQRYLLSVFQIE